MTQEFAKNTYAQTTWKIHYPLFYQKKPKKPVFFFIFVLSSLLKKIVLNYGSKGVQVKLINQKRCLILISLRHLLFMIILRNIKEVNEIMRFLYPKYRRNRLTDQHAGGGYNDQSNYCQASGIEVDHD